MSPLATADAAWDTVVDDAPVAVTAAAGLVAVAGADGTAWVLDAATGEPVATVTLPGGILAAGLSPNGAHLALAGPFGHALWSRALGTTHVAATGAWSSAVRWAGTDRVAVASGRRALVLGVDGRELWTTDPAPSTVTDLAWHREGRRLATAAYNGVRCYERHSRRPVVEYPYLGSHLALAIAPTGKWICSGNQDASIHIWRILPQPSAGGTPIGDLTMHGYPEKISRLAFDDTGFWLASDGAPDITVWDFAGPGPEGTRPRTLRAHETVTALAWRPGGGGVLASAGAEGVLALWRATTGRPGAQLTPTQATEYDQAVTALAWSGPDLLVHADWQGRVRATRLPAALTR
ncbi:WD40 repeat domain-containing protein [Streptacidiphilus monticola]|uniref:WD40 repeat domain-containing protein n=1 Tax=Streptacidiphilus monticola TaxID=2161674 RepID=A0ABW1G4J4_9ACTN